MTPSIKNIVSVVIVAFFVLTSCNPSDTPKESVDEHVSTEPQSDSTQATAQTEHTIDSVTFLGISFIENLEMGWRSSYKNPRLTKNGFNHVSSRNIKNGKERVFRHRLLETELKISKVEYPDGEKFFTVNYQVTPEQLQLFEESLNSSPKYQFKSEKYVKKGLGTYAEKYFSIDSNSPLITYVHRVGKELSPPPIHHGFDSIQ